LLQGGNDAPPLLYPACLTILQFYEINQYNSIGSSMQRDIQAIAEQTFDLVIVGAGIFGACAAWEAARQGLKVAVIEKKDFSHATSAHHFKMIHGGMRYLQHLDLYRLFESSHERSALIRIAPHLAYPLPILMPTYGHGMKGKEILRLGFRLYEMLTINRNKRIEDPARKLPPSRYLPVDKVLELYPKIEKANLTGGVLFCDGQMYNPPRIALSFLRSAVQAGAVALNYTEVTGYLTQRNEVQGVNVKDLFGGDHITIRARCVLNASGPWADQLNRKSLEIRSTYTPSFSRDLIIVVKKRLTNQCALSHLMHSKDTDALFDRGGRHLFLIPWRDYTLIGVWHKYSRTTPDEIIVKESELQNYISEANRIHGDLNLSLSDITMVNTGLILFGSEKDQKSDEVHSFGKRSIIIDHHKRDQIENLVTLIGVRATVARGDAEIAMRLVLAKLGKKARPSNTAFTPIYGGKIGNFEVFLQEAMKAELRGIHPDAARALIHNYGSEYRRVIKYAEQDRSLAETFAGSSVLKAEAVHAVREEMACKLEDVVFRRTELGTGSHPGDEVLRQCASIMAKELVWNDQRVEDELDIVRKVFMNRGPWLNA
jgi:glycerol-3-phosphate dehydrogenase